MEFCRKRAARDLGFAARRGKTSTNSSPAPRRRVRKTCQILPDFATPEPDSAGFRQDFARMRTKPIAGRLRGSALQRLPRQSLTAQCGPAITGNATSTCAFSPGASPASAAPAAERAARVDESAARRSGKFARRTPARFKTELSKIGKRISIHYPLYLIRFPPVQHDGALLGGRRARRWRGQSSRRQASRFREQVRLLRATPLPAALVSYCGFTRVFTRFPLGCGHLSQL